MALIFDMSTSTALMAASSEGFWDTGEISYHSTFRENKLLTFDQCVEVFLQSVDERAQGTLLNGCGRSVCYGILNAC